MLQITPNAAIQQAAALKVPACGHRPGAPYPPFPTTQQIAAAKAAKRKRLVVRPDLKPRLPTKSTGAATGIGCSAGAGAESGNGHHLPATSAQSSKNAHGKRDMDSIASSSKSAMSPSTSPTAPAKRMRLEEPQSADFEAVVNEFASLVQPTWPVDNLNALAHNKHEGASMAAGLSAARSMGPLMDRLPADMLSSIMSLLACEDLTNLGMTCHGLWRAVKDGAVWRDLLHREFPTTQLSASSAADWAHAYALQVRLAASEFMQLLSSCTCCSATLVRIIYPFQAIC